MSVEDTVSIVGDVGLLRIKPCGQPLNKALHFFTVRCDDSDVGVAIFYFKNKKKLFSYLFFFEKKICY